MLSDNYGKFNNSAGGRENAYNGSFERPEGDNPIGKLTHTREDNIKMNRKEIM
jgi:hypothetical protein